MAQPARSEDRRGALLQAACRVIVRDGAHDLRVEDVAREAGVSPALVYYYFDTRARLLGDAFGHADSISKNRRAIDESVAGIDQVAQLLLMELEETPVVRDNWVMWSEMCAVAVFNSDLRSTVEKAMEEWVGSVERRIRAGKDDGSIRADVAAKDAAERLTAVVDNLGTKWILGAMGRERARRLVRGAIASELATGR